MSRLRISGVHKSFGAHSVLNGLDLSVPAGSLTTILGPSGSGKTTLLRLLAGFDRPDGGTITIGDRVVDADDTHVHPEHRRIGYVPQEGSLFPHLTVRANVAFGLSRTAVRARVRELLELVGLADLMDRYPHQLSGGEQQRVALARALAVDPAIVLLDEPFASLDAHLRAGVREDVRRILRESEATALLVTHDQDEALSVADLVAVLRNGRIVQHATPQEIYTCPVDRELACFVGEANLVEGVLDGGLVQTEFGTVSARSDDQRLDTPCQVTVLLRPEQIELQAPDTGGLNGLIVRSGYHGHDAVLHVQTTSKPGATRPGPLVVVRIPGEVGPPPGSSVSLSARGPVLVWPARPVAERPPVDQPIDSP